MAEGFGFQTVDLRSGSHTSKVIPNGVFNILYVYRRCLACLRPPRFEVNLCLQCLHSVYVPTRTCRVLLI